MQLGNFSISLAVKDIQKSKEFYETLGFTVIHGEQSQGWLILKNGDTNIGLFQGMFDSNILTFNPGWDSNGNETKEFTDVREIQKKVKDAGIAIQSEIDPAQTSGPASFSIVDPDGNQILIDQHRS
ncbi:MAG: VOC family protein [Leptospiraceae bacterium]|nr:VOC family protein [Leptospiraceae bacterium]